MIRTSTIASLALCGLLGFGLYRVKYEVQSLEDNLVKVNRQVALDQEQMHVLNADWSYFTQPTRLEAMAQGHVNLVPLTAAQLGNFDTLPLKGDNPSAATSDKDVPVEEVLKAMQVAATPAVPNTVRIIRAKAVE